MGIVLTSDEHATAPGESAAVNSRSLLAEIFAVLDQQGVPYCVMGNYENLPDEVATDVDLLLATHTAGNLTRVATMLASATHARILQAQQHRTGCTFTFCRVQGSKTEIFDLDLSHTCGDRGVVWVSNNELFAKRQRHPNGFWVATPAHAFAYYLAKRAGKACFSTMQVERLRGWMEADRAGCGAWMAQWFSPALISAVEGFVSTSDSNALQLRSRDIARQLRRGSVVSRPRWQVSQAIRLFRRFLSPIGFSVVFLGPDGCGKSTVGKHALSTVLRAFRGLDHYHLRPRRSNRSPSASVTDPYGKAARSLFQSLAKLGYFWFEYTAGYLRVVRPALVRNRLVAFDRYYCDLIADPRRYRFGAPIGLARLVGRLIPQPHLYVILDAPAEVLQARKQEVSLEQSAQQRQAYLGIARSLPNAVIIDAARPLDNVVADVTFSIFEFLASRTAARLASAHAIASSPAAVTPQGGR